MKTWGWAQSKESQLGTVGVTDSGAGLNLSAQVDGFPSQWLSGEEKHQSETQILIVGRCALISSCPFGTFLPKAENTSMFRELSRDSREVQINTEGLMWALKPTPWLMICLARRRVEGRRYQYLLPSPLYYLRQARAPCIAVGGRSERLGPRSRSSRRKVKTFMWESSQGFPFQTSSPHERQASYPQHASILALLNRYRQKPKKQEFGF